MAPKGGLLKRSRSITQKAFVPKTLKPQNTRRLIRRFHVLLKNKNNILAKLGWDESDIETVSGKSKTLYTTGFDKGVKENNIGGILDVGKMDQSDLVESLGLIDGEIKRNGGLDVYQTASTQGQNSKRGGDSSKKLVEWLKEGYRDIIDTKQNILALEIGCLSPENHISTSGIFQSITRIDLHSQHHQILEQDFMKRPLPESSKHKFNLISCSLVINFVPTPKERGDMLRRITKFLQPPTENSISSLFLVVPAACVNNSRYLNTSHLLTMMKSLGFQERYHHISPKLAYFLFDWNGEIKAKTFKKKELVSGNNRNNFCIVME